MDNLIHPLFTSGFTGILSVFVNRISEPEVTYTPED